MVVDFQKYKEKKEQERTARVVAYNKFKETKATANRHDFDYQFLQLVDMFMQKHMPCYQALFEKFLEDIEKNR